jgi:uncharacterized membrane protein YeaQ/YmgE (transglycosylase-associated protein family)
MEILVAAVIGGIVGVLAGQAVQASPPGGTIAMALLGVLGGALAAFLGQSVGWYRPNFFAPVVGAALLLVAYRLLARRTP